MKQKSKKGIVLLVIVAFLALGFRYTFITAIVQGESMLPTLHHLDTGLTDRWTFRFLGIPRFSIVVFTHPSLEDHEVEETWIKRVIGTPGDTIYYEGTTLMINGVATPEPYLTAEAKSHTCDIGLIQDGDSYHVGIPSICLEPLTLGEEEYFVMGDNREDSYDSRYLDSPISRDAIYARGLIRYGQCEDTPGDVCSEFRWAFPEWIGW